MDTLDNRRQQAHRIQANGGRQPYGSMSHVHQWKGIGSRTKGLLRKRYVVILGCSCGKTFEAEVAT